MYSKKQMRIIENSMPATIEVRKGQVGFGYACGMLPEKTTNTIHLKLSPTLVLEVDNRIIGKLTCENNYEISAEYTKDNIFLETYNSLNDCLNDFMLFIKKEGLQLPTQVKLSNGSFDNAKPLIEMAYKNISL